MTGNFASPTIRNPLSFGKQDFNQILDSINDDDQIVFLVNQETHEILATNAKITEVTAFTRNEIISLGLGQILSPKNILVELLNRPGIKMKRGQLNIHTRYRESIPVTPVFTPINKSLGILKLAREHSSQFREGSTSDKKLFDRIYELTLIPQNTNSTESLSQAIETGGKLIGADSFAIYLGNGQKPSARRAAVWGTGDIFPLEIFSTDINELLSPTVWQQGQRSIVTLIHQSARKAGLSFMASAPIGEDGAFVGVLVSGGKQHPAHKNTLELMKIIGAVVSEIIHKTSLLSNLENSIENHSHNLSIMEAAKDAVSDGIFLITPELKISDVNLSGELILGYTNREINGVDVDNIFIGTDRLIPAVNFAFQGVATPNLGNIQLHRRDGSAFPADIKTIPIQFLKDKSSVLGVLIILRDRSEDEQIRIRAQQLEQRALLGEVTAIFAHEVRNPINNISTGLQLMSDEQNTTKVDQELVNRMQQDCNRLTTLMESVLTFSRTGNYTFSPVKIDHLIERIINRWKPRMNRLNITHHFNSQIGNTKIYGDQRSLEQVFTNLISNAVQAMQDTNQGVLAIKLKPVSSPNNRTFVQIDVSDTGPGIPEENQQKIFDPFFTTKKEGTGLGLSITKQIVTAHKGSIALTSFLGGTVFHIKLPTHQKLETPQ